MQEKLQLEIFNMWYLEEEGISILEIAFDGELHAFMILYQGEILGTIYPKSCQDMQDLQADFNNEKSPIGYSSGMNSTIDYDSYSHRRWKIRDENTFITVYEVGAGEIHDFYFYLFEDLYKTELYRRNFDSNGLFHIIKPKTLAAMQLCKLYLDCGQAPLELKENLEHIVVLD